MVGRRAGVIGAVVIALAAPRIRAQSTMPRPSAPSDDLLITEVVEADALAAEGEPLAAVSGHHPLAGALRMDIGSWGPRHSYVVPGFTILQGLAVEPEGSNSGNPRQFTSLVGQAQAIQYFGKNTELRYIGAIRYDSEPQLTGASQVTQLHAANFSHDRQSGRWNLLLNEQVQYSKGSLLGGTGLEGMGPVVTQLSEWSGNQGIQLGSVGIQGGLAPDQSILALNAGRISNSTLLEVDRLVGDRSLIVGSAFFGLLHFDTPELTDGWQSGAFGGYERAISGRDRLGCIYGDTQLWFSGSPVRFTADYASAMYARTLSGKLALDLAAGPLRVDGSGADVVWPGLDWQGRGSIVYHRKTLDLGGSIMRGVTGGSGVLNGAMTNLVQANVTHRMSRIYEARYDAALSHNTAIANGERYNTQYGAAILTRNASRGMGAFVTYTLQRQQAPGCVSDCSFTGLRQLFGVGLSWGTRPIGIH